jgi:hypothetical protein
MKIAKSLNQIRSALLPPIVLGGAIGHAQSVQWRPEVDVSLSFKRANVLIPSLTRLDSDLPNPQFVATGVIGTFRLDRHWSSSTGYLFADLPQHDQVAHVPLVATAPSWTQRRWTVSDNNRFERLLVYSNEPYRYRNRAGADYAFGKRRAKHLYASNESFVNLTDGTWNQNSAQAGLGILFNRITRLDAYFLQRSAPGVITFRCNTGPIPTCCASPSRPWRRSSGPTVLFVSIAR